MKGNKTIQVFEHERLILQPSVFEQRHLNALSKLNEVHGFAYFDFIPNGVKFKQYVGILQVDNLSIEILPKADKTGSKGDWQRVLIQMLKACGKLNISNYGDASINRQNLNLLEVYFQAFLNELGDLIQRGLIKKYRKRESNLPVLKGKLLFSKHISRNIVRQDRFYTEHITYDYDHELHQILALALSIIQNFTAGSYLFDHCKRIELNFPEVTETRVTKAKLDNFKFNRKSKPYQRAFELARLIILNYSPGIKSGSEKMLSILFDMNKLWEQYVYKQLRKASEGKEYAVLYQRTKPFWRDNRLEPDILIVDANDEDKVLGVLDTKWKNANGLASIQDLRQMYAYGKFWKAEKLVLLYPGENEIGLYSIFRNEGESHKCKLVSINVLDENKMLDPKIGLRIMEVFELEEKYDRVRVISAKCI